MFYSICIISVVVFGFSATGERQLPFVNVCERNSTNYFNCLKFAIQEAWPQFVKGLPEFDLPSLDPIIYEFGKLVFDIDAIHGKIKISNFTCEGLAKTRFAAVKAHFLDNDFRLEIDVQIPKITGCGECDAVGTLGGFRIGGKGRLNITMEDIQESWIIKGHVANDIWTVEDFYAVPSIGKTKLYFDDLFNNKELNNLAIRFVNKYWSSLYQDVLTKIWSPWLSDLANRIFSKVSFSTLFP